MGAYGYHLELVRPGWLPGLLVLPLLLYGFRRSLVDLSARQRAVSLACRAAIATLLVLALAGLTLLRPTKDPFVVFALDESLSVGDDSRKEAEAFVAKARERAGGNRSAYVTFAASPGTIADTPAKARAPADPKGTDLAAAIEVATAACPPFYVPKVVLLSDGNQTAGDGLKAALRAGVPIDTVPLKTRTEPEVQVSEVRVPAQVLQGEPFFVEVVVNSNHDDEGTIEVYRGAIKVAGERKKIKKGENRFRFRQSIDQDRLATFTARARNFKDEQQDNNSESGLVFASGKPRVLLIESEPRDAKELTWALEEQEIQVDVRPPQGMPDSLADLQNYELLIISNVPATKITARQMDLARTYVRDLGGGLIMLGGDQSFGLGGYYKTALEEVLPVRSDFEKEKEKPSLAMMLVIDKSGSMGGEKIELVKDAAKGAIELLGPNDKVGVIAFDGQPFRISELHPCTDKGFVIDRVATIEAGGGTNMHPAMEEAFDALQRSPAKLKHAIILTDGISAPGDFEGVAASMASARITVTTVGVGEGCDQDLLEEIARIGNGRYYFTDDPASVPQIFAKETMAASKSAINEMPFNPQVIRPTRALAELDFATAPPLLGYVVTRPKPTSELILASEAGDPLLAWWRYGLGMSVAFTSDAKARWGAEWLSWPGYGRFWAQVIRHAMRNADAKGVVVSVDHKNRHATVTLDAIDPSGRFLNDAQTELTVIDSQLGKAKLTMAQTAPGRYQAEFDTPLTGAYHLEFALKSRGQLLYQQSRGLSVGYPDELRLRPTNVDFLKSIARVSHGRFDPKPEQVFAPSGRSALRAAPLRPILIALALLIFVADVALRRIDFSLLNGRIRRVGSRYPRKDRNRTIVSFSETDLVRRPVDTASSGGLAMRQRIYDRLRPVMRRQRGLVLLWGAAYGLLAGSAAGVVLGLAKWVSGRPVPFVVALSVIAFGPAVGLLLAALRCRGWRQAAAAVDAHHRLKDRAITALDFLARPETGELHELQLADAAAHLDTVVPRAVVPFRWPRALPVAMGLLAVAIVLLAWPLTPKPARAGIAPAPENIVAEAEKIQEDLKELDKLADVADNPELKELIKQLRDKAEEMKQPGVEPKEALAKLSEMETAIAARQAQFNLGLVDGQLQSLGDAMVTAKALEAAGRALQEGKFEQAAKALEKLEDPPLDRKEARAVEEKLNQVAKQMGEVGLGQLGDAASEMAEGIKGGHQGKFRQGAKGLAKLAQGHAKRKRIFSFLEKELAKLSECKGNCQCDKASLVRAKTKRNSPTQSAGLGISGNVDGDKTNMASNRSLKEITGQAGDGSSEMETTHSPEGRQTAARGYRESYQKYRKMSEAVLDSEPIPLGHRQTIRRYFELIRPRNGEGDKAEAVTDKPKP